MLTNLPDFDLDMDITLPDLLFADASFETTETLPTPVRYDRKNIAKREYINGLKKQALTELIKELPPPDTDLHILSNGSGGTYRGAGEPVAFEFGHFIPVLVEMLGGNGCTAYISTWTANRQHVLNMLNMLDTGALKNLAVMTDPYFKQREAAVCNTLITGLLARGQRFVCFKNHVKAVALQSADGLRTCCVLGSANLSSQPRSENFMLTTDQGLYTFLRDEFFEVMLNA